MPNYRQPLAATARSIGTLAAAMADLVEAVEELAAERDTYQTQAQRANGVLRELVAIVDPALWHDGQVNSQELLDVVRSLVQRPDMTDSGVPEQ